MVLIEFPRPLNPLDEVLLDNRPNRQWRLKLSSPKRVIGQLFSEKSLAENARIGNVRSAVHLSTTFDLVKLRSDNLPDAVFAVMKKSQSRDSLRSSAFLCG